MPCTITREEEIAYEKEGNKRTFGKAMTDAEVLTALLCEATRTLEAHGLINNTTPLLQKWTEHHRELDRQAELRARGERDAVRLKKRALAKLSLAERRALGHTS